MRKEFNITGSCNPEWHYRVDTAKRFALIENLIEKGKYFTINRARQYGKTTTLDMIWRRMSDRYLVVLLSFEGLGDSAFASEETFVGTFSKMMTNRLASMLPDSVISYRRSIATAPCPSLNERVGSCSSLSSSLSSMVLASIT